MPNRTALVLLPAFALLAACGGQEITVTNDSNVVLNDALDNYAFINDGANVMDGNTVADPREPMMTDNGMGMTNDMTMNETMPANTM